MDPVLAVMHTFNTYGTWLRGDARGWVDKGMVFPPNPELEQMDSGRMRHPPFLFPPEVRMDVGEMMGRSFMKRMGGRFHALTVGRWHVHAVVSGCGTNWAEQVKCMKDAVRWGLRVARPIWGGGYDKRFCFTAQAVTARVDYVRRHNVQDGLPPDPWDFIVPFTI